MTKKKQEGYQVLARKYRPQKFSEMVGQEVLIQTLSNEIKNNKIVHSFILTGIRGVGKTTTARLIAKSLNCIGKDGDEKETIDPCGVCAHCTAIANFNDPDVIEFDAASHTGVGDIRNIIENISYAPVSSRYKIYIIDEVHMLSNSAFNALLKTLEEPPAHVKFIFATTEIRKVPITILSRCQRFDLRRLDHDEIVDHLQNISSQEDYEVERKALSLIASATEGAVRDSMSLLDRALSHNDHQKNLTEKTVFDMLGLASKNNMYDLFEKLAQGDVKTVLEMFNKIYGISVDIGSFVQDLLDVNYQITLAKVTKDYEKNSYLPSDQKAKAKALSEKISLGCLSKVWQMLLKGYKEVISAPNPKTAIDMLLIRICYGSNMPSPSDIIKKLQNEKGDLSSSSSGVNNDDKKSLAEDVISMFDNAKIVG